MEQGFYELIMDNLSDGIYVLDKDLKFVYVNAAYCTQLRMTKDTLIGTDVHDFLQTKQIDFCIADMVREQKKKVVVFQNVYDALNTGRKTFRQLVIATPIFDEKEHIRYILAVFRRLETLNEEYSLAENWGEIKYTMVAEEETKLEEKDIIAKSPQMQKILSMCREIADTDASVLITGDSGTGKEVIAHYVHEISNRKDKPFVVINCASLPENLLEAELFGYEKGAFTGATGAKKGLFEQADQGTLFLDEINSMPLGLQSKLLRAIETKQIRHIGSNVDKKVDFRLLVATNEKLENLIEKGIFRKDLYYRINVVPIWIPPLRERKEDILPLALKFLTSYCKKNKKDKSFSPQMLYKMELYSWPGNVRELKNFVERSVLMSMEHSISIPDIPGFVDQVSEEETKDLTEELLIGQKEQETKDFQSLVEKGVSMGDYLDEKEYELLKWAQETYGSTYKIAKALGTSQAAIMRRKKKYNL